MFNTENLVQNQQTFANVIQNINRELQDKGDCTYDVVIYNVVLAIHTYVTVVTYL